MSLPALRILLEASSHELRFLNGKGADIINQGHGFGDLEKDTDILADKHLGELYLENLKADENIAEIMIEGLGYFSTGRGNCAAFVDPLDNSQGYYSRENTTGFPFSSCVAIANSSVDNCRFSDFIRAGIIDHRTGDVWLGEKSDNGGYTAYRNGDKIAPNTAGLDVSARQDTIITDLYYLKNRLMLPLLFPEEKGIFRNPGSAALEMVYTTYEKVALYFCFHQKLHELAAAYVINKGAGREVLHINDRLDLSEYNYEFNTQMPVLIARNKKIAEDFMQRLENAKPQYETIKKLLPKTVFNYGKER